MKKPTRAPEKQKRFDPSSVLSTGELSRLLKCTPRMITELESEGVIKKIGRGSWPVGETFQKIVDHYRIQRDAAKAKADNDPLDEVRRRKMAAEGKILELKYAVMRGQLHPSDVITAVYAGREQRFIGKLKNLPPNTAKLAHGLEVQDISVVLQKEVQNILREFDEIDQATILKLNKQYVGREFTEAELSEEQE